MIETDPLRAGVAPGVDEIVLNPDVIIMKFKSYCKETFHNLEDPLEFGAGCHLPPTLYPLSVFMSRE